MGSRKSPWTCRCAAGHARSWSLLRDFRCSCHCRDHGGVRSGQGDSSGGKIIGDAGANNPSSDAGGTSSSCNGNCGSYAPSGCSCLSTRIAEGGWSYLRARTPPKKRMHEPGRSDPASPHGSAALHRARIALTPPIRAVYLRCLTGIVASRPVTALSRGGLVSLDEEVKKHGATGCNLHRRSSL